MPEVKTEITQRVKEIIAEQLGKEPEELTEETSLLKDLKADSLDAVEVVMELEDTFEISIPDGDAQKLTTVGEIVDYIKRKKMER